MIRLLAFIIFMSLGTGIIFFFLNGEKPSEDSVVRNLQSRPDVLILHGVHHTKQEEGHITVDLKAKRAFLDQKSDDTRLDGVQFTLLDIQNKESVPSRLSGEADHAFIKKNGNFVDLRGHVIVHDDEGRKVTSKHLIYDGKLGRMSSPGAVRVSGKDGVQEGSSMDYNLRDQRMLLTKPRFFR